MNVKSAVDNGQVQEMLGELAVAMAQKDYDKVDQMLTDMPSLVKDVDVNCQMPLNVAIINWDPELVKICLKHDSDPAATHLCSKDKKPKNATLVAAQVLIEKHEESGRCSEKFDENLSVYTQILSLIHEKTPIPQSGE